MVIIKYLPIVHDWSLKLEKIAELSQMIIKVRNLNRWKKEFLGWSTE